MEDKTIPIKDVCYQQLESAFEVHPKWDDTLSYRALFEQTGECIFIISLDFHYITANQQALDLLGYKEHELIGKPVDEVVSQEEMPENVVSGNQHSRLQERILKCKDGRRVPVEISTTIVYDENCEPVYIQSIARDISIRKKTEQTLKRNARILSVISKATAGLLQSSDIDKNIPFLLESLGRAMNIYCCVIFTIEFEDETPYACVKFEWSSTDLSDDEISEILNPYIPAILDNGNRVYSAIDMDRHSQNTPKLSFASIPLDTIFGSKGFLGFLDVAGYLNWSQSEMDALQTTANLISAALKRKKYEETIRLSEARNRIIVDALPDLIMRVDINGNILDYSAKPEHPLYIHRDLAYGRNLNKTFPEQVASQIVGEENKEAFVTSKKCAEIRLPYANGTYETNLYPICSEEALIIVRDVTEQVKLNEMKSDFINRASHELRTPLTSAMLMVDLIQEGGEPEEVEECWRTLKQELQRQKVLIDRLLTAGRLESGMMKIDGKAIDLLPVLRESMQSVQPIVARRDISMKMTDNQNTYTVWGDSGGLQHVFINLLNNAAKFSPEGSLVEVDISQNETHVNVAIIDKGVGIPQEDIPHLFERFFRAKNVTIAEIPGSGIGLFIVNSIVKELGGEITVESVPGQGTTFTVCLKREEKKG